MRVGQKVTINHPKYAGAGVFTVVKVNRVNTVVESNGQRVRCHPSFLVPVAAGAKVPPVRRPAPASFVLGQTVKLRGKTGTYVVIGVNAKSVSLALLGGDGGRYLRCTPSMLTKTTV